MKIIAEYNHTKYKGYFNFFAKLSLLLYCFLLTYNVVAQPTLKISDKRDNYELTSYIEVLEDKKGTLSLKEAITNEFTPIDDWNQPDYDVNVYWAKFKLYNAFPKSKMVQDWLLAFNPYNVDITVFLPDTDSKSGYSELRSGSGVPYDERAYHPVADMSRSNVRVSLPSSKAVEVYVKFQDDRPGRHAYFDTKLFSIEKFGRQALIHSIFNSFLVGGLFMMLIIVVILNWFSWRIEYYYYILYLACLLVIEFFYMGVDNMYLSSNLGILSFWTEQNLFAEKPEHRLLVNIVFYITYVSYLLFIREFLELPKKLPHWNRVFQMLMLIGLIAMLAAQIQLVVSDYDISAFMRITGAYIAVVYIVLFVFMCSLVNYPIKRKLLIILGLFITILGGIPLVVISIFQTHPLYSYAATILLVAFFIEKIIFTFALSFRQRDIETKLRKNEEKQKMVLRKQNEKLEAAVKQRTKKLTEQQTALKSTISTLKNTQSELESSFTNLQNAQTKLVESEKMASLGVLTAGVAHEINNPINFIANGIDNIEYNFVDLIEAIEKYKELDPNGNVEEQLADINEFNETIELEDLIDDSKKMFVSIRNGVSRTVGIVKSLKNFSRLDEEAFKEADIHEGIESTLEILTNKIKNRVEIIRNYGVFPKILCNPGKLNQVFMNIIGNAAQAIEGEGTIKITTKTIDDGKTLQLEFEDSGSGMDEETKNRIFEPFFTTKEVGQGTGLGLSITYGIIQEHEGDIEVESEPGKGTKFIIRIPFRKQVKNNE